MKFPFAEKVLSVCKFLVFDPLAVSTEGEPIMAEGMLPLELWDVVSVEDYLQFRLYGLELISIMLGNFHHFVFNFAPLFQFHFTSIYFISLQYISFLYHYASIMYDRTNVM